jgi:hypothetical protein
MSHTRGFMEVEMGSSVHGSLYEKAMDQLEDIIDTDPDFEDQSEEEFIQELAESSPSGFTTDQVNRIGKIHKKYCGEL